MADTLNRRAAANIRAELARRDLTHDYLADKLGVTRPTVSILVSGATAISLRRLEQIAGILEIDPARLLD